MLKRKTYVKIADTLINAQDVLGLEFCKDNNLRFSRLEYRKLYIGGEVNDFR